MYVKGLYKPFGSSLKSPMNRIDFLLVLMELPKGNGMPCLEGVPLEGKGRGGIITPTFFSQKILSKVLLQFLPKIALSNLSLY